jgi:hypothetical protein
MRKSLKRLKLNRETLGTLSENGARAVRGAASEVTVCYSTPGGSACCQPGGTYISCACTTFTRNAQGTCLEN